MDLINNRSTSKINLTRLEMTIMHSFQTFLQKAWAGVHWRWKRKPVERPQSTETKVKQGFYIFPVHILSWNLSPNINIHVASVQAVCLRYFIINLFISPDKLLINGNGGLAQLGNLCLNKSPTLKVLQNCQAYILTTSTVLLNLFDKNHKLYK